MQLHDTTSRSSAGAAGQLPENGGMSTAGNCALYKGTDVFRQYLLRPAQVGMRELGFDSSNKQSGMPPKHTAPRQAMPYKKRRIPAAGGWGVFAQTKGVYLPENACCNRLGHVAGWDMPQEQLSRPHNAYIDR